MQCSGLGAPKIGNKTRHTQLSPEEVGLGILKPHWESYANLEGITYEFHEQVTLARVWLFFNLVMS